jgi:N-acetylglutamate synthase-like GNAT family acetyltransferase
MANHQAWVAEADGDMLAVLELIPEPDAMTLEIVEVSEPLQGTGVGCRLLDFAEAEAVRQGYGDSLLYTNEMMGNNAAFYVRRGFEEMYRETVARTHVIYENRWRRETAIHSVQPYSSGSPGWTLREFAISTKCGASDGIALSRMVSTVQPWFLWMVRSGRGWL